MKSSAPRAGVAQRIVAAFTLIELLIVVAIIAILAAIIFPVFAQAREKAKQVTCLSQGRDIGLALLQYTSDYDDRIPPYLYFIGTGADAGQVEWQCREYVSTGVKDFTQGSLSPYLKNIRGWECPSADLGQLDFPISYGLNQRYLFHGYYEGASLADVEAPSETIVVADSAFYFDGGGFTHPYILRSYVAYPPSYLDFPTIHGRHHGVATVVWFDGHVKGIKPAFRTEKTVIDVNALRASNIGDILKNGVRTGDTVKDDYYFALQKPEWP